MLTKYHLLITILVMLFCTGSYAQVTGNNEQKNINPQISNKHDSLKKNTSNNTKDTLKENRTDTSKAFISSVSNSDTSRITSAENTVLKQQIRKPVSLKEKYAFYLPARFYDKGVYYDASLLNFHNSSDNDDILFYSLAVILFFLGIIKVSFPKYFRHIFQFILQPGLRKKNAKDGFGATNIVPSFLFNLVFIVTGSLYLIISGNKNFTTDEGRMYWILCALILACVYVVKFFVVKLSGWIFNAQTAANIYNYVVFSVNKIIGIILIPIIIIMAYSNSSLSDNLYICTGFIIVGLLLYRYIASFILIRGDLKVSILYFFLYLCAIEILPLLIIYKILLMKFGKII
ncbi:MAG: DUF4271 domain-containing protein [Arachidicoccus sp.]|nr:DUF4271 domain-containing protein [Arachidicoccus sp.]